MEYVAARQPLHESGIGMPSDLDGAVIFFMGDQSRYVTGQVLAVDGGWSVSDGRPLIP
jgi:NAD(P)-dependent dehydrogenase (short-subunit alcohol dehydrogenase family)